MVLVVLYPVRQNWAERPKDNFPLSYFPLFSHKRGKVYSVNHFIGFDRYGNRYNIPYNYAGTGGFNQVRRQMNRAAKSNRRASSLTRSVARKVERTSSSPMGDIVLVQFVRGDYHMERYLIENDTVPVYEEVISSSEIKSRR